MAADVDCVVIGGGVVGLAIARALTAAGREVLLLERHARTGEETSSRNSEVIHAGIYYPPGSHKARLCVEGKRLLYAFAIENGIPFEPCGKLIVAPAAADVAKLERIAANARACGVPDLLPLDPPAVRALEPEVVCAAAYLSPSTGIVDSHALLTALEGHIQANGGTVALGVEVEHVSRCGDGTFRLVTRSGGTTSALTCSRLVIAAGLWSSDLARGLGSGPDADAITVPRTRYAKGHYFTLAGRAPFSRLIYPMPVDGGLGVHLTLDLGGFAKFGPDVEWIDRVDYTFEDHDGARREAFVAAIRTWWPGLPEDRLQQGYTGVRPKLSGPGEPPADFALHGPDHHAVNGLFVLYGIESPGLTASLAIGLHVAQRLV